MLQFDAAWQDLPPLKTPRSYCGMAMWGPDKIVVVGGCNRSGINSKEGYLRSVEIYDIFSCQWTELPSLTRRKAVCAAIVVNDKLYVFGGFDASSCLSDCEVLDLSQPESHFTRLPNDLPQSLSNAVVVSKGHWIYVVGGFNGSTSVNAVYALDIRTNQWNDRLPPMNKPRVLPAVAILDDRLVVVGGKHELGKSVHHKSVETLHLATSIWANTIKPMPLPRAGAMAFVELGSSNLIIAGGEYTYDKPASEHLRYDGISWSAYGNFPAMTDHHGSMVVAASMKCLRYVDTKYNIKGLSLTTNESVTAINFGPDPKEEARRTQKAEAERKRQQKQEAETERQRKQREADVLERRRREEEEQDRIRLAEMKLEEEEEERYRERQQEQDAHRKKEEIAAEVERHRKQREADVLDRRREEEEEQDRKRLAEIELHEKAKQIQKMEAERKKEEEDRNRKRQQVQEANRFQNAQTRPTTRENESGVAPSAAVQEGRLQLKKFLQGKESDPLFFPAAYLKECTGNFSESQRLGSGGFGAVFLANDAILQQKFVVKRPELNNPSDADMSGIMESFKREIAVSIVLSCEC